MIRRSVKIQLFVFLVLGTIAIGYAGLSYVGFSSVLHSPTKVYVNLPDSGGVVTNSAVTERGVNIGKVGTMTLTTDGVRAQLLIDHGKQVPKDVHVVVANLSFVGEQYVDLQPKAAGAPFLADGDVINDASLVMPPSDSQFLANLDSLVASVNPNDLKVVVDELGTALQDGSQSLQTIIDKGDDLTKTVTNDLPQQLDLINKSQQVLGTVRDTGGDLRTFAQHLASLSNQIKQSDPDLRRLFDNGIASAQQLDALIKDIQNPLPQLLGNLVTVGQLQAARLPGLKQLLIIYPEDIRNGFYNAPGDGTSHFGLVFDNTVGVCTKGYESTKRRTGDQLGDVPANLKAYCDLPTGDPIDVRGSRNAPRPAGDKTDPQLGGTLDGQKASTDAAASTGTAQYASWDPQTQLVTMPDGTLVELEPVNSNASLMGADSWKWIFLGVLSAN